VSIAYAARRGWQLPWFTATGRDELPWFLVGLGVVAGGGLLALGIEFFATARRVRRFSLLVCRNGLVAVERGRAEAFRWAEVALIEETVKQEYFPLKKGLKYLCPLGKSHSYLIRRNDGVEIPLDGNVIKRLHKLRKLLWAEAQRRGIDWQTRTL
jgi:hypothetical protein